MNSLCTEQPLNKGHLCIYNKGQNCVPIIEGLIC